jgi:hypothetical protein
LGCDGKRRRRHGTRVLSKRLRGHESQNYQNRNP